MVSQDRCRPCPQGTCWLCICVYSCRRPKASVQDDTLQHVKSKNCLSSTDGMLRRYRLQQSSAPSVHTQLHFSELEICTCPAFVSAIVSLAPSVVNRDNHALASNQQRFELHNTQRLKPRRPATVQHWLAWTNILPVHVNLEFGEWQYVPVKRLHVAW